MFFVFNKKKINSYLISLSMVVILLGISFVATNKNNTIETSVNAITNTTANIVNNKTKNEISNKTNNENVIENTIN